jgi:tRNA(Ile)-lysidine synthase
LRYQCFYDALGSKKCDKIATAHHLDDNVESVLFNLFRGTGAKGAVGIEKDFNGKIIRPFLGVEKVEIEKYTQENSIPFVTDSTNACCDYTRNALRLKVIPEIKKLFPKMQDSILRFTEILKEDNDYLSLESKKILTLLKGKAQISIPCHYALFSRATINALKHLGIDKDYEKTHIDDAYSLLEKQNGNSINLPKGVIAIKEYDKIVFFKAENSTKTQIPFTTGELKFLNRTLTVKKVVSPNLKSGFFLDLEKIPDGAVIRTKKAGDTFTKFGGGTKSLGDFLTDKKIPQRERDLLPIIASGSEVLAIFGLAVSNKVKVDNTTKTIIQISIGE